MPLEVTHYILMLYPSQELLICIVQKHLNPGNSLDDKIHYYAALKKIYSPAPCIYKNYHKVVMFPPDWQILLSHIIFPSESFILLISALFIQLSPNVMGKSNILHIFILITF